MLNLNGKCTNGYKDLYLTMTFLLLLTILFGSVTDDDYQYRNKYVEWRNQYDNLDFFDNEDDLINGICNSCKKDKNSLTEYIVTFYPIEQIVVIVCNGLVDNKGKRIIDPYIESIKGVKRVVKGKRIFPNSEKLTGRKRK